jgi:bifunctional enzyme CysN/CysC
MSADMGFASITPIPLSARYGDNVTAPSPNMDWYNGPTLLGHLETVDFEEERQGRPFRFPVQYVLRPDLNFRGFAGTIAAGTVQPGDPVVVAKSGKPSTVKRIVTMDGDLDRAVEGQAVALVLDDEIEVSRGNMLVAPDHRPDVADQFAANIVWFAEDAMLPGRQFILRTETDRATVSINDLRHRINVNSFAHEAAKSLELNEVGYCHLTAQSPIAFDPYAENRATGAFILIDRVTNATVGAGMIVHALRRASNVHWQALDVDKKTKADQKGQKPAVLWFTGLSGSGKSTIANLLEKKLLAEGRHSTILDGDNVRHGLNRDLGFTEEDRVENIRRVGEVSKLMVEAGLITLVSFISPFRAERQLVCDMLEDGEFIEIFVDTPFEECAKRDPKGLYAKALKGEIKNFTGVDSPYEAPENPDIHLQTSGKDPEELLETLEDALRARGIL